MINLFYVDDGDGKIRFKKNGLIERFDSFYIRYSIYNADLATAIFHHHVVANICNNLKDNEIARIGYDLKYDREFLDAVKNTKNVLHPVNREEFFDWLKEHYPDIMTHLLWYI